MSGPASQVAGGLSGAGHEEYDSAAAAPARRHDGIGTWGRVVEVAGPAVADRGDGEAVGRGDESGEGVETVMPAEPLGVGLVAEDFDPGGRGAVRAERLDAARQDGERFGGLLVVAAVLAGRGVAVGGAGGAVGVHGWFLRERWSCTGPRGRNRPVAASGLRQYSEARRTVVAVRSASVMTQMSSPPSRW